MSIDVGCDEAHGSVSCARAIKAPAKFMASAGKRYDQQFSTGKVGAASRGVARLITIQDHIAAAMQMESAGSTGTG